MGTRRGTLTPDLFSRSRDSRPDQEGRGPANQLLGRRLAATQKKTYRPRLRVHYPLAGRAGRRRTAAYALHLLRTGPGSQIHGAVYPRPGLWLGTDEFGRSMWDRIWAGTRVSLYIALLATAIDLGIGMFYGAISAYYGGGVDNVMQRAVELLNGIPFLVVVLMMLIFEPGILTISLALGLTGWTGSARLIRGQVLRLKQQEFFLASRALGASARRLILKHLVPNVLYIVIITLMFTVPSAIFSEAFLSFIGLEIAPPDASLGALISDGSRQMRYYPYLLIYPSLVLCLLTVCFRLLGDGLRDAFDPRMRR